MAFVNVSPFLDANQPLYETVPNFAEGRQQEIVDALATAMGTAPDTLVLDRTADPDHHRCVITAVSRTPQSLSESAFAGVQAAMEHLDIRTHQGVHPRVGVADVIPLIPMRDAPLTSLIATSHELAVRIAEELKIPVYCYEAAALRPERAPLSFIRNRGWEFLRDAITDPLWAPDYGPKALHPTAGACMVGVRFFLIAFNIHLECGDLDIARKIASRIRATAPGGLPGVRALGFRLAQQDCVQVSVNLIDFRQTTLEKVFEWVERLATMAGVKIRESELIGLIPEAATIGFDMGRLRLKDWSEDRVLEHRIARIARIADSS